MTKFIYLPTIRHTGTFSIAAFLLEQPDVRGYLQLNSFTAIGSQIGLIVHGDAKHFVLDGTPGTGGKLFIKEKLVRNKVNILQTHIRKDFSNEEVFLMHTLPTVIPLRDPLASLIPSCNRKENMLDHLRAWKILIDLVRYIPSSMEPVFLSVDLPPTDEQLGRLRMQMPTDILNFVGRWPTRYNNAGDYEGKMAYKAGDIMKLQEILGVCWNRLRRLEPILRPFLEEQGYKDLLWWS